MITKFKLFETLGVAHHVAYDKHEYSIGDIVVCISGIPPYLMEDEKYEIKRIYRREIGINKKNKIELERSEDDRDFCDVVNCKEPLNKPIGGYCLYRFVDELEYDAKKYNL